MVHIRRTDEQEYYSKINETYDYIRLMPAGSGTLQNRVNTNFRFITHIPQLKLVFSTTMQVVWYESQQNVWQDGSGNDLFSLSEDGKFMQVMPSGSTTSRATTQPGKRDSRGVRSTPRWSASPSRPPTTGKRSARG